MMKKDIFLVLTLVVITLLFGACDRLELSNEELDVPDLFSQILDKETEKAEVMDVSFSPDYKSFTLTTDIIHDIGPYELSDSSNVRVEVEETIDGIREARFSTPRLVKIKNIEAECLEEHDIRMLALVDLSLPQEDLNRIREQVREMKSTFKYGNFFIAFMDGPDVSNTMAATDYVTETHFKHSTCNYSYLYRSILRKKNEMLQREGYWQDAEKLVMVIFSDGKVYNDVDDEPIDPDHYIYQERLTKKDDISSDTSFLAYFATFYHDDSHEDVSDGWISVNSSDNLLRLFCRNNGGAFIDEFQWESFKDNMFSTLQVVTPDYIFYFENPDYKVYRGDDKKLTLKFYDHSNDSLIFSVSTNVVKGECFNPIIVRGHGFIYVVLQGLFLGAILLLFLYLVLQVIVPFIKYRIFRHRYVIPYTGSNMCFDNKVVEESCYLCKAPFEVGDNLVVKCEHTMHESCWDENEYHCPEHGDRCKHGSHYYNKANIFDPRNAPFYLKWLLVALAASTLAWLCFVSYVHLGIDSPFYRIAHSSVTQIPAFGFSMGFFLTLGFSFLTVRPGKSVRLILRNLGRAMLAAIGSYLAFLLVDLVIYLFDIHRFTTLLNWIPWTLSGFTIAWCSTYNTHIVHKKLMLLIGVLLGFLSMYAWTLLFSYMELDFRTLLMLSFIIFGVGLAACIASIAPRSERYFLKVQGATKGMDIALYKWFRNQPDRIVTIGKSVDCSLQLSWDLQSDIAPIQSEIRFIRRTPYLIPLEQGVFVNGKPVRENKKIRLYHGKSFSIGKTTFTYIEKDR